MALILGMPVIIVYELLVLIVIRLSLVYFTSLKGGIRPGNSIRIMANIAAYIIAKIVSGLSGVSQRRELE